MLSGEWWKIAFVAICICLWFCGFKLATAIIVIAFSFYRFVVLQKLAYNRYKKSISQPVMAIEIAPECQADVDLILCRGNMYQFYNQDADRILDSW